MARFCTRWAGVHVLVMAAAISVTYDAVLTAQSHTATPHFDIARFAPTPPDTFETFHVRATISLQQALEAGRLADDSRLLVTEIATGRLALVIDQMGFHHLAQGEAAGQPWMVSF
jgi:hypothetical protein